MSKAAIDSANENSSLDAGERAGYIEGFDAGLESAAKMLDARATDLSKIPGSADSQTAFHLRHLARDIREAAK